MPVIIGFQQQLAFLGRRLSTQLGPIGRAGVDSPHAHLGHRLVGIIGKALGIDHQPRNRVDEGNVVPLRMAAEQIVREPVRDHQELCGKRVVRQGNFGTNLRRDQARRVRNVKDHCGRLFQVSCFGIEPLQRPGGRLSGRKATVRHVNGFVFVSMAAPGCRLRGHILIMSPATVSERSG